VLTALFFVEAFHSIFLIADYYVNTQAYTVNCVNKNKPQMHCNGKCQLSKKIQQESKKDQDNPERKLSDKNETVLSSKSFAPSLPLVLISDIRADQQIFIPNTHSISCCFDIFHPPQA
jgi:hypothetical protein